MRLSLSYPSVYVIERQDHCLVGGFHRQLISNAPHSFPPHQWIWEMKGALRGEVSCDANASHDQDRR